MKIFIAGTDTDVGKTFVTAGLTSLLLKEGIHVGVIKWAGTGGKNLGPDIEYIIEKAGSASLAPGSRLSVACPYSFSFPASPHLSAALEGKKIDPGHIMEETERLEEQCDVVLIEGVGGLMVPLTKGLLLVDLVRESGCPVVLVSRSGLGTINHTLLSVEIMRQKGIALYGIVFNSAGYGGEKDDTDERIVRDNISIISDLSGARVYGPLPFGHDPVSDEVERALYPLSQRMLEEMK